MAKIFVCKYCRSDKVSQQVSTMVSLNSSLDQDIPLSSVSWDDFYMCDNCQDSTLVEEI